MHTGLPRPAHADRADIYVVSLVPPPRRTSAYINDTKICLQLFFFRDTVKGACQKRFLIGISVLVFFIIFFLILKSERFKGRFPGIAIATNDVKFRGGWCILVQ